MNPALRRAAVHATLAAFSFACMGAFAKAAAQHGASNALIVFARNLVCVAVLAPLLLRDGWPALRTRRLGGHAWRAGFGVLGMYSLFYAITHLRLAEAMLLNSTAPLFIPFLAWAVLGERPARAAMPLALLGLAGVALIVKPGAITVSLAAWVGASSGVFAACAMVSLRRISDTEPPARIVFYFALLGLAVSVIPMFSGVDWPTALQGLCLLATGLCATLGQLELTRAYASAPAAPVSALGYSGVVFAALLGWMFWRESLDGWSALGAVLIISTCLGAAWQKGGRAATVPVR